RRPSSDLCRLMMVGLGRLELPTSRLSSARSNQLSYKPWVREQRTDGGGPECLLSSVVRRPSSDFARSRRKRSGAGGVPPSEDGRQTTENGDSPRSCPASFVSKPELKAGDAIDFRRPSSVY